MLTSAADYVYNAANVAASAVDIQGRIIPTEDINGQPHPLRRENFAYLSEAMSERLGAAYWSCPAKNAPLHTSDLGTIAAAIPVYYADNLIYSTPDASAYIRRVSSVAAQAPDAYHVNLLTEDDCNLPPFIPATLDAEPFRYCFYAVNQLRFGWQSFDPAVRSFGGSVSVTGFDKDRSYSGSAFCDNTTPQTLGSSLGTGTRINTGGKTFYLAGDNLWALDDWSAAEMQTGGVVAQELDYSGWMYFGLSAKPAYKSPRLFLRFEVYHFDASVNETKYVWVPLGSVRTAEDSDGFAFLFGTYVDRSFLRGVVTSCFSDASFALTGTARRAYVVSYSAAAVLAEFPYKSILPSAWTWTPT